MKISQLFSGEPHIKDTDEETGVKSVRVQDINRQIQALIPGQTIRGEIVSGNGTEIQIKLAEDLLLNARVDLGVHLEQGQVVTFEVRNNGSSLSLSPLFTNISADVTILKAIEMAGLPVNQSSVEMTKQLMNAGLPVNRSTLQQVFREIHSYPANEISDVVNLHRMQMPVNDSNMQQMTAYRNMNHSLLEGMHEVLDQLPETLTKVFSEGKTKEAVEIFREIMSMISGEDVVSLDDGSVISKTQLQGEATKDGAIEVLNREFEALLFDKETGLPASDSVHFGEAIEYSLTESLQPEETANGTVAIGEPKEEIPETGWSGKEIPEAGWSGKEEAVTGILQNSSEQTAVGNQNDSENSWIDSKVIETIIRAEAERISSQGITEGRGFKKILEEGLKEQWMLRPEELVEPGKVEELYRRLHRQLKELSETLENGKQQDTPVYKAVTNMVRNLDFIQQVNQMFTYLQLPLHINRTDTHGDLYIYTNKRSLAKKDGNISALLHLDMEHLGPLDVYVALQGEKVNTRFCVADEGILDFLEQHMNLLTDRLQRRGYDCKVNLSINENRSEGEAEAGALEPLWQQDKGSILSQYAFDVRT